ncbi:MAG: RDD family protein [Mycobacterium sp.]
MARALSSWLSGPEPADSGLSAYPGEVFGFPESGPGSAARSGRRFGALLADWLMAYGLAGLLAGLGIVPLAMLSTAVLVIWLLVGAISVRLFQFTPGQYMCGLMVVSIDNRMHVGLGRALSRGLLVTLVIPALYMDSDGRGLQDKFTYTAVVRR